MPAAKKAPIASVKKTTKKTVEVAPRGAKTPRNDGQYIATGTYNPKAEKNQATYADIVAVLPATLKEIEEKIPQHTDFVGYLIRRGGIAPA